VKTTAERLADIKAWTIANKARVQANKAAWYQKNKERINEPKRLTSEEKRMRANARRAKWRMRPEVRAREKEQRRRYRATPEYRARRAAWWASSEGRAYKQAWRAQPKNRVQVAAYHRNRKYGVTDARFRAMVADQEGKCCGCLRATEQLVVDHDHTTGLVRGLLCSPCNKALGMADENSATLRRLADYKDSYVLGEA
jgi:hypothetical protein